MQKFAELIKLRFDVSTDRPVTVLVHNGAAWEIVPSESDADGKLVADVDHLTPYVTGSPTQDKARAAPTAAPKITPGARVTVTSAPTSSSDAQAALESAVAAVKGKKIKITSAAGYTGSLYVALPGYLQTSLNAIGTSGVTYYGLYNAVNEAISAQAKGGAASGALTLLVEPKTTFPANATDAKNSLATTFAGIPVSSLAQSRAESTAYVFYGASGNTAYSIGYISYNGVPLAYGMVGSGSYQSFVPK